MLDDQTAYEFGGRTKKEHKGRYYQPLIVGTMFRDLVIKYPRLEWNIGASTGSAANDRFMSEKEMVSILMTWVKYFLDLD